MGIQTLVRGLVLLGAVNLSVSLSYLMGMEWLSSDGTPSYSGRFDEGETLIYKCQVNVYNSTIESLEFQMKPYSCSSGSDMVTIARGEQIVDSEIQARLSNATVTVIDEITTDYRITLSNVDRHDSGNHYFCKVFLPTGSSAGSGSASSELNLISSHPELQCSSDITDKAKKGEDVTYQCAATDTDRLSSGTMTMWRGDTKLQALVTSTVLDVGKQYNASYSTNITDDSLQYVYSCRYVGTGGFEEYASNCTFNQPTCVVEDWKDKCGPNNGGTLPWCGHLHTIGFLVLIVNYITSI